jgi:dihydropyrimidinase
MDLLVKGGTLVTATDTFRADVRIAGEKIVQIGDSLAADPGVRVVDATGKYVMPAGVDRTPTWLRQARAPPPPTTT